MLWYELDIREYRTRKFLFDYDDYSIHSEGEDEDRPNVNEEGSGMLVIGDREILCLVNRDGFQIWFFNPNFVPNLEFTHRFIARERKYIYRYRSFYRALFF